MRDKDLRKAMREYLANNDAHSVGALVIDEFSVDGMDRIDIATVGDVLTGYELKSSSDNLSRLERQVRSYGRVMDYIYLVTTVSHLKNARNIIPKWWGIITVKESTHSIALKRTRKARSNPDLDSESIAQLLWRDEALSLLTEKGLDKGYRTKTRDELCRRLANEVNLIELRRDVRERIKGRRGWRESPILVRNDDSSLHADKFPHFLARRLLTQRR